PADHPITVLPEPRDSSAPGQIVRKAANTRAGLVLVALLALFVLIESFLPLASAIKIGADEDFELSKPVLCLHGYRLYSEVWNDQPPLYTFLITQLLRHVSRSVA